MTEPSNPASEPDHAWRLWRSATTGWVVAALALLAGIPLFLRMPPWNDVTLHDLAARSILRGGVHYRDVFDTNLPGIDWSMAAVRWLFGWSYEVLRAVDLVVVAGIVFSLAGWVRRCGTQYVTVAWFVAAAALFYPFTSEFNHVQRDVWMLLPAVVAARLRLKRVGSGATPLPTGRGAWGLGLLVRASLLEGFIWGLAVWFKPHVVIPAFAVWVVSAILMLRSESGKRVAVDLVSLLLGGVLAGLPGVGWMIATGAWPYFLDIFLHWNPDYLSNAGSFALRVHHVFDCFPPWSLLHYTAIPLAVIALWEARVWSRRPSEPARVTAPSWLFLPAGSEQIAAARAILAAFYLAWLAQAVLIQKPFEYVHLPLTLLAMAVVAGQRWCFGFVYLLWFIALGIVVNVVDKRVTVEQHPLTRWEIVKLWPRCWSEDGSLGLRDQLGQFTHTAWGTNWRELNEVAEYLRSVNPPLKAGELDCWNDTTHPLYLMLNLDPATRYMHYGTVFEIKSKKEQIAEEVRSSPQRYVVSDLQRMTWDRGAVYDPHSWRAGDPLPVWLPPNERQRFPWNQPVVFRAGRYVVHRIDPTKPLGVIRVPDWDKLDRLGERD